MKNAAFSIEELFRFLDAGVSAFHSTAAAAAILEAEGYVNCPESAAWELAPGGKYYTTRNGSAVLAWRMLLLPENASLPVSINELSLFRQ